MPTRDSTHVNPLQQTIEEQRQQRRRERAFLRSPVTAPEHFPRKELRRLSGEAKEELLKRG
jgi:hypothetical protein